jgi:type 1 fimbriae regulatory protein FimB
MARDARDIRAGLAPIRPHMLRRPAAIISSTRVNDLQLIRDYLDRRDPKHTVHYTRIATSRFEGPWKR